MTEKFLKYDLQTVFRDKSKGGLLFEFLTEYKKEFNTGSLNPSCKICRKEYWTNYQNLFKMSDEIKSEYILKAKYNGIQLGVNGQPIRNGEMTDKIAKELIKKHPHGKNLFSFIPEPKVIKKAPVKKAE